MCQVSSMENAIRIASSAEIEANARLIAAAPDLLAALEAFDSALIRRVVRKDGSVTLEMDFKNTESSEQASIAARSAIAKAKGESHV